MRTRHHFLEDMALSRIADLSGPGIFADIELLAARRIVKH